MIEKMVQKFAELKEEYSKFISGNKSAGARARKILQEIKKLAQEMRIEIQNSKKKPEETEGPVPVVEEQKSETASEDSTFEEVVKENTPSEEQKPAEAEIEEPDTETQNTPEEPKEGDIQ